MFNANGDPRNILLLGYWGVGVHRSLAVLEFVFYHHDFMDEILVYFYGGWVGSFCGEP